MMASALVEPFRLGETGNWTQPYPAMGGVQESLAGRFEIIYLHPLSEQEKQHSHWSLLQALLEGNLRPSIKGAQKPPSLAAA